MVDLHGHLVVLDLRIGERLTVGVDRRSDNIGCDQAAHHLVRVFSGKIGLDDGIQLGLAGQTIFTRRETGVGDQVLTLNRLTDVVEELVIE